MTRAAALSRIISRVELAIVVVWLAGYNAITITQLTRDIVTLIDPSVITLPPPASATPHRQNPDAPPSDARA